MKGNKFVILALALGSAASLFAGDVYLKSSEGSISNSGGFTTKAANWDPEEAPADHPLNDYFVTDSRVLHATMKVGGASTGCWELNHFKGHSLTIDNGYFIVSTLGKVNSTKTDYYKEPSLQFDNGPLNLNSGIMSSFFTSENNAAPQPQLGIYYPRSFANWNVDINVYSPKSKPFVIGNWNKDKCWVLDYKFNGKLTGAADTGLMVGFSAPTSTWLATYLELSNTANYLGSLEICSYSKVTFDQCRLDTLKLASEASFILSGSGSDHTVGTLETAEGAQLVYKNFGSTLLTVTDSVALNNAQLIINAEDAAPWWEGFDQDPTVVGSKSYPFLKLSATAAQATPIAAEDIKLKLPDAFYAALADRTFSVVREEVEGAYVFKAVITRERPIFIHSKNQQSWESCDFINANAWSLASGQTFVSGDDADAANYNYVVSNVNCRAGTATKTLYMHGVYFVCNAGLIVDSAQHVYPNAGIVFEGGCSLYNWASTVRYLKGKVVIHGSDAKPVKVYQGQSTATKLGMNFDTDVLYGESAAALSLCGTGGAEGCVMSAEFKTLANYRGALIVSEPYQVTMGNTASEGLRAIKVEAGVGAVLKAVAATTNVKAATLELSENAVIEPTATSSAISQLTITDSLAYTTKVNLKMPAVLPRPTSEQRSFTVLSLPANCSGMTLADFAIDETQVTDSALLSWRVWEFAADASGAMELKLTYPRKGLVIQFK